MPVTAYVHVNFCVHRFDKEPYSLSSDIENLALASDSNGNVRSHIQRFQTAQLGQVLTDGVREF